VTRSNEEQAARRLLHIKEITERIVEDLGGDPDLILRDRIHAGNAERQLEKIGEAAKALSEELRLRQRHGRVGRLAGRHRQGSAGQQHWPEIHWGGWGFTNCSEALGY